MKGDKKIFIVVFDKKMKDGSLSFEQDEKKFFFKKDAMLFFFEKIKKGYSNVFLYNTKKNKELGYLKNDVLLFCSGIRKSEFKKIQ